MKDHASTISVHHFFLMYAAISLCVCETSYLQLGLLPRAVVSGAALLRIHRQILLCARRNRPLERPQLLDRERDAALHIAGAASPSSNHPLSASYAPSHLSEPVLPLHPSLCARLPSNGLSLLPPPSLGPCTLPTPSAPPPSLPPPVPLSLPLPALPPSLAPGLSLARSFLPSLHRSPHSQPPSPSLPRSASSPTPRLVRRGLYRLSCLASKRRTRRRGWSTPRVRRRYSTAPRAT